MSSFKQLDPFTEAFDACFTKFRQTAGGFLDGFLFVKMGFGIEFIRIADELFFQSLW